MNIFKKIKKTPVLSYSNYDIMSDYSVEKMLKDPQVKACINIKKMIILQGRYSVHPVSKDKKDREICDFVTDALYKFQGTISSTLFNVLDAFIYGFSLNEIVYKREKGRIVIDKIIPINPGEVDFQYDNYGNIVKILINNEECNRDKLILYSYNGAFGNPYGKSDLLSVYKYYDTKVKLIDFYNVYLEKYASPLIKGIYKKGFTVQHQKELFETLKSIKQKSAVIVPEECDIENMNLNTGGAGLFQSAIDYQDRQIAKGILGQTIFTDDNVTVGSYSLANIHLELLKECLGKIKKDLEEFVVTEQIIKPLVKYNFGGENYPYFTISDIDSETLKKKSDSILDLINNGIVEKNEYWLREFFGLPECEIKGK